jgi:hypothetical protein
VGRGLLISCARATRGLTYKKVEVEQRSIRLDVFSTLNLDLSHDLPMGRAQWGIYQALPVWPVSLVALVHLVSLSLVRLLGLPVRPTRQTK